MKHESRPQGPTSYAPPPTDHSRIAARWRTQYFRGGIWKHCGDERGAEQIHAMLVALGLDPSPADIEAVIDNDSWTR